MAKTRYDKAWEILGSALSDQSAAVYQAQREQEEEEFRRQQREESERLRREEMGRLRSEELLRAEGRARAPSLDQLGTIQGMTEALKRPSPQPDEYTGVDYLKDRILGAEAGKRAASTTYELGDLEDKYATPEQRAAARKFYEDEVEFGMRDRSTFQRAAAARKELEAIAKAEEYFTDPAKLAAARVQEAEDRAKAEESAARAEQYENTPTNGFLSRAQRLALRTGGDIGSNYESLSAVPAGLIGAAIPVPGAAPTLVAGAAAWGADVQYKSAYADARNNMGMNHRDAVNYAKTIAASEFVIDAASGGIGAVSGGAIVKDRIVDSVKKHAAKKMATGAVLGGASEAGTTALQGGINYGMGQLGNYSEETKKELVKRGYVENGEFKANEFFDDLSRSALAGGAVSGTVGGGVGALEAYKEAGRLASDTQAHLAEQKNANIANTLFRTTQERVARERAAKGEFQPQQDLFGGPSSDAFLPPVINPEQVQDTSIDASIQERARLSRSVITTQLDKDLF